MTDAEQRHLLVLVQAIIQQAPLYTARTPHGKPFAYQQTGAGWGWTSDAKDGYRYQREHPVTGQLLPPIPQHFLDIAADYGLQANAMLINVYGAAGKLGMHVDWDELCADPVVSISLGNDAIFLLGGTKREEPVQSITLSSGMIMTLAGPTRYAYHGVDRIVPGTDKLSLCGDGRINITLRNYAGAGSYG